MTTLSYNIKDVSFSKAIEADMLTITLFEKDIEKFDLNYTLIKEDSGNSLEFNFIECAGEWEDESARYVYRDPSDSITLNIMLKRP